MKNPIQQIVIWVLASLVFSSCIHYKYVFNNDLNNPTEDFRTVCKELEAGDWVTIKVHNRTFENLEVANITEEIITVKQYSSYKDYQLYELPIKYIQRLALQKMEMDYPVGGPLTLVIVIMYFLV